MDFGGEACAFCDANIGELFISWVALGALELVQWEYVGIICKIIYTHQYTVSTRPSSNRFGDVLRIFGLGNHGEEWGNIGKSSILDD